MTGARQLTAPAIAGPELELLRVELAAAGLGADQVEAVAGIVSSGRAGDVLIGPAGTGKSYTVSALAQVWAERVGGRVLGLATTEIATRNLAEDGVPAMNTARFLAAFTPDEQGNVRDRVRRGDLFVVDEAGMCSTAELARIADIVAAGGGKLVYTGDQGQLTSVGAGGMLALLVADNGAHQLEQVHRFDSDWEREASLRLRAGDTSVIPEYEDRGRLQAGTAEQMQAAAVRGYLADTLDGKDSLLIVGSNDEAAQLVGRDPATSSIDYGRCRAEPLTASAARAGKRRGQRRRSGAGPEVDRTIRVDGGQHVGEPGGLHGAGARPGRGAAGARRRRRDRAPAAPLRRRAPDPGLRLHGARGAGPHRDDLPRAARRGGRAGGRLRGAVPRAGGELRLPGRAARPGRARARSGWTAPPPAGWPGCWATWRRATPPRSSGGSGSATGRRWRGSAPSGTRCPRTPRAPATPSRSPRFSIPAHWSPAHRGAGVAAAGPRRAGGRAGRAQQRGPAGQAMRGPVRSPTRSRCRTCCATGCGSLAADRTPEQPVQAGHWTALAPPVDGPVGQFSHELAVLAEDRQHALGQAALADPPAWAVAQLGPVPTYDDLTAQVEAGVPVDGRGRRRGRGRPGRVGDPRRRGRRLPGAARHRPRGRHLDRGRAEPGAGVPPADVDPGRGRARPAGRPGCGRLPHHARPGPLRRPGPVDPRAELGAGLRRDRDAHRLPAGPGVHRGRRPGRRPARHARSRRPRLGADRCRSSPAASDWPT